MAAVGKETFTVEMKISLPDGKILSASMDNPVETIMRMCDDEALTQCTPPSRTKFSGKSKLRWCNKTKEPRIPGALFA